jgi:hypothetical protein
VVARVLLSHASEDHALADEVLAWLTGVGHQVFLDRDLRAGIAVGDDSGDRDGTTTTSAREIRELKRKNADLEQTIEILKAATSFFVRESDPRRR